MKECLNELLMEAGLNKIIDEGLKRVAKDPQQQEFVKSETNTLNQITKPLMVANQDEQRKKLAETKKAILDKIGTTGFDPFAGTTPADGPNMISEGSRGEPMGIHPELSDGGVDISGLIGNFKQNWSSLTDALSGKKE